MWKRLFGAFGARVNEFATSPLISRAIIRYERTEDPGALDRAITLLRQRLTTIAIDHPRRAVFLVVLGELLGLRYERVTMELEDLHEAVFMAAGGGNDPYRRP